MKALKGHLLLAGGAEFGGQMEMADRRAIELAGGKGARIEIIPAAAAPDDNHRRAGERGVSWFTALGAEKVINRLLVDRVSAENPEISAALGVADLVYLLGGFPGHLASSLAGTKSWEAIVQMLERGGVLAGSSAGAMVLAEYFFDPLEDRIKPGLGLLPGLCVIPHYQKFSARWREKIRSELPRCLLLGIDEETGIIDDADRGWRVYGRGDVHLIGSGTQRFGPMETIPFARLAFPKAWQSAFKFDPFQP